MYIIWLYKIRYAFYFLPLSNVKKEQRCAAHHFVPQVVSPNPLKLLMNSKLWEIQDEKQDEALCALDKHALRWVDGYLRKNFKEPDSFIKMCYIYIYIYIYVYVYIQSDMT